MFTSTWETHNQLLFELSTFCCPFLQVDNNAFQRGFHWQEGLMGERDSWGPELDQKLK